MWKQAYFFFLSLIRFKSVSPLILAWATNNVSRVVHRAKTSLYRNSYIFSGQTTILLYNIKVPAGRTGFHLRSRTFVGGGVTVVVIGHALLWIARQRQDSITTFVGGGRPADRAHNRSLRTFVYGCGVRITRLTAETVAIRVGKLYSHRAVVSYRKTVVLHGSISTAATAEIGRTSLYGIFVNYHGDIIHLVIYVLRSTAVRLIKFI